ncbi:MAG TPA: hypothetical protein VFK47_12435, partial [Ktedonobacteraceae bacterium]|nr:hypothetical protein [Ktedonobacteraceae bacterium]
MPRQSKLADPIRLAQVIEESTSQTEILQKIGLRAAGGNFKQLKKYAEDFGLYLPSYDRQSSIQNARTHQVTFSNEEVFVENSSYSNRAHLKTRLRDIWDNWVCVHCGIGEEWNGKTL